MRLIGRRDDLNDRQIVCPGELPVALVVARHRHNGACAIGHQYEIGGPDRHGLARYRMQHVDAEWHAALFHRLHRSFRNGTAGALFEKLGKLRVVLCRRHGERMLRGHRHVGHAHQRVGTRGVDIERLFRPFNRKAYFDAARLADPVALHDLDRLRPVDVVQFVEQFFGVVGDAQEPLRDLAPLDQRPGAPAAARR